MATYLSLLTTLSDAFPAHKARIKVLTALVLAIIKTKDVNLMTLAVCSPTNARQSSQYRQLQRFFQKWALPWKELAHFTISRIPKPRNGYILSMDRTNWQFGKTHINILVIGIVVGKVSVPLAWSTLAQKTKNGNSNTRQRMALVRRVLHVLPASDIYALAMDREFNGNNWLEWLNNKKITWILRLRKNTLVGGKSAHKHTKTKKGETYSKKEAFGIEAYFGCKYMRKGRSDYLYVLSNNLPPLEALACYKKRWSIEVLFGHLKEKGFRFENTNMTMKHKINKMMAVLAISFLLSVSWGLVLKEKEILNAHEKRKSIFRLGVDHIGAMLENPNKYSDKIALFMYLITGKVKPHSFVV